MVRVPRSLPVGDHFVSTSVHSVNEVRAAAEAEAQRVQQATLDQAMREIDAIWRFIESPENILGSDKSKHGEVAEHLEVHLRRAFAIMDGKRPTATFEGVGRTAPEDYLIGARDIQSKFYASTNASLNAIRKHMEAYPEFATSNGGGYHLPKEQFELILKVLKGKPVKDLDASTLAAIKEHVREIEAVTGKSFSKVVLPSISTHSDVQLDNVDNTLKKHEQSLKDENQKKVEQIQEDHKPSWGNAAQAAAAAAAVGVTVSFASDLYRKYKDEGKNPFKGDYTAADWKSVGLSGLKGGAAGAATGLAIYGMTNLAHMAAPAAGAFVAASKGMTPLIQAYRSGELSMDELLDQGTFVCADAALVGLATAGGQALIPVPILGAVLGSIAGKVLAQVLKGKVARSESAIEARYAETMAEVKQAHAHLIEAILAEFDRLGKLADRAFDLTLNESLTQRSLDFGRAVGVPEEKLVKNRAQLMAFLGH